MGDLKELPDGGTNVGCKSLVICTGMSFRVSVHESDPPIRPENGVQVGWVVQEVGVPQMALREVVRALREEGYDDAAILIERE